jgi:hypothetical protein
VNILQLVVVGMILIIIATVTLAVLSYAAFKVRERRAPVRNNDDRPDGPLFFERVRVAPRQQPSASEP